MQWTHAPHSPSWHFFAPLVWQTGPAYFGHALMVSPFQGTTFGLMDERSLLLRLVCHRILDALPLRANDELVRTMAELYQYYVLARDQEEPPLIAARRPISKVTRSVRPEISLEGED
jgi:hypothetical protein